MRKILFIFIGFMIIQSVLFAVDTKKVKPVLIDEAIDACEWCHMAVKSNGYAAELITDKGKVYKFDDIGCLLRFKTKNTEEKYAGLFVQDVNLKELISLDKIFFVDAASIPTPMSSGIHSFKTKESAEKFIKDNKTGVIISLSDLEKKDWKAKHKM